MRPYTKNPGHCAMQQRIDLGSLAGDMRFAEGKAP